jgi:hypothetical protein
MNPIAIDLLFIIVIRPSLPHQASLHLKHCISLQLSIAEAGIVAGPIPLRLQVHNTLTNLQ